MAEYFKFKKELQESKTCSKTVNRGDHLSKFFQSMEETVRNLPLSLQVEAKSKISNLVHQLETQALYMTPPFYEPQGVFHPQAGAYPTYAEGFPYHPQFGANQPQVGANQPQVGVSQSHVGANQPQFGANLPQGGGNQPQLGGSHPQFGDNQPTDG